MKAVLVLAVGLAGCAYGTNGVVQIGPDLYMVGGLGGPFDYSGSAVKAKFFKEAAAFCAARQQTMVPVGSTGKDSSLQYASAEVQFRCVEERPSDAASSQRQR